jgi:hypothetical protein
MQPCEYACKLAVPRTHDFVQATEVNAHLSLGAVTFATSSQIKEMSGFRSGTSLFRIAGPRIVERINCDED